MVEHCKFKKTLVFVFLFLTLGCSCSFLMQIPLGFGNAVVLQTMFSQFLIDNQFNYIIMCCGDS